jgi:hypothetical protein
MRAETVDAERFTKWRYTVEPVDEDGKSYGRKQFFANELQLVSGKEEEIPEGAAQSRGLLKKLNRLKPTADEREGRSRVRRQREEEEEEPMQSPERMPSLSPSPPPPPRPVRARKQPERLGWIESDYMPPPPPPPPQRRPRRKAKAPSPLPVRRSNRERKQKVVYDISSF